MVGKLILLSKMQRGLEGRTKEAIGDIISPITESESFAQVEYVIRQAHDILHRSSATVYLEVAESLGIDSTRYRQITSWVYEHETSL